MIKKSLLLTLLLAILAPWAAQAQETVTIGEGTATSNSNPIGTYYNYSITEQLYTAEEIGTAGTISSISFYYMGIAAKNLPITVYMANVDAEDLTSGISLADADEVFSGTLPVTTTAGWVTINLATPFDYDGTSNLLIGFIKDYLYYFNGQSWQGTATTTAMARYTQSDSAGPYTTSTVPGTAQTNRPNIQIVIEPASTSGCEKPDELTANGEPTDTEFSFTIVGGSGLYNIFTKAGDGDWTNWEYEWDNTEVNLTNLESNTAYQVRVQSVCTEMTDPETGDAATSGWKTLNFTTKNPCAAPTNLQVTDITAESATLSWTAGYQETEWTVKYKKSADSEYTTETVSGTPSLTLSGLASNTVYNVQVFNCENYVSGNFTTAVGIPLTEAFATTSAPTGWAKYSGLLSDVMGGTALTTTSSGWNFSTGNGVFDNHAKVNLYGTSCKYWLVTPTLLMENNVQLTFDLALTAYSGSNVPTPATNGSDDKFVVLISTDNMATWTILRQWDNAGSQYVLNNIACSAIGEAVAFDLSSYAGQSIAIAFYGESTVSNADNNLHIDNVSIDYIPACAKPTGLAASDVTAHEATITWTSDAEAWQVQLNEETPVEVTDSTTYTFTELDPETTYSVKVRANCGGTYSDWTNAITFTTGIACPAPTDLDAALTLGNGSIATLSWTSSASAWVVAYKTADDEDFTEVNVTENPYTLTGLTPETAYTAKVKAVCGGIDGESQWSSTVTFTPTNAYMLTVNDGTNTHSYVPFYGYYADSDANSQFIIPASALSSMQWGTINKITLYGSTASATWNGAVFDIYFSEVSNTEFESAALVDWSNLDNKVYTGSVSVADNKMELTLTTPYQYMGGNLLIGFDETTNSSNYPQMSWYGVTQTTNTAVYQYSSNAATLVKFLPKVTFAYEPGEEPSCIKPSGLAVNYEGGITATVTWEGTATSYNIDVNGTVTEGITSPYALEDLDMATTYAVMVQADCGDNGTSEWTNPVSFTTDLCLPENQCEITFTLTDAWGDSWNGNAIQVVDVETGTVLATMANEDLNGTSGSGENEVNVKTLAVCDGREIQFSWVTGNYPGETSYVVTDINGEVIFEGSGAMSEPVNYTVSCAVNPCRVPTDLAASEISTFKADLSWTGYHDAYNLQYRHPAAADPTATTATVILTAGDVWGDGSGYQMLLDADATAYGTIIPETVSGYGYISTDGTIGGSAGDVSSSVYDEFEYKIPVNADGALATENIVINNSITIAIPAGTYDWCITNPTSGDRMWIASSNGNVGGRYDDFVFEAGLTYEFTISNYGSNDGVDVTITPMVDWILVENLTDPSYELTGLDAKTMYEWQVQGISDDCENGVTEWSAISSFFTEKAYYWNDPQTWTNDSVPAAYEDVTIPANTMVVIPSGYPAYANEISFEEGASIYIEEGGQLYHSNEIPVALQMNVEGYDRDNGGYVLIAAPAYTNEIDNTLPVDGTNLNTGEFDLYAFDQSYPGAEWRNFKAGEFDALTLGQGYLYANSEDINNIVFNGQTMPTNATFSKALVYNNDSVQFPGWNLVGNPFTCIAYIDHPFYTMSDKGDAIVEVNPDERSVEVMQGIFVVVEADGDSVTFTTTAPEPSAKLTLNLSQGRGFIDRAIVRFDEGHQLPKIQLNPNHTKVYIPMDGKDYAVVRSEEVGELPVNFKAETDGTYNLSFTTEEVSFNYLHLIDNMTGADVDLLETPSYTFEARSTDYANRFKLVFATGTLSVSENFAFFNNGNLLINNEGEATVQVIDINGRILSSETINGSANINVNGAAGVYMIRLINGENVRVQKVVVR